MKASPWRTTAFRLTLSYALILALTLMASMGAVYWKSAEYFSRIGDIFVIGQASVLVRVPPSELPRELEQLQTGDIRGIARYGLFTKNGVHLAGNIDSLPADLPLDGNPYRLNLPGYESGARATAQQLRSGEILVTGYDAKTLSGIGDILLDIILWAASICLLGGLALGLVLAARPLKRVHEVQIISKRIADGDLSQRLPLSKRGDELDVLSSLINQMMGEVEYLLSEVRSMGNNLAHDLRTPLNRLRANLHRLIEDYREEVPERLMPRLYDSLEETEHLLTRFRAIQRISEIDSRARRSEMRPISPEGLLERLASDFQIVADEASLHFEHIVHPSHHILADEELLAEAIINLLDNAMKFTPAGGKVLLALRQADAGPVITVSDNGPGVPERDKERVLLRFGRCARDTQVEGGGLGLAIVAAIVKMHGFTLDLKDANPGLTVEIHCTAAPDISSPG
ncbi:ATP-binding protein [Pseudomonas sp. NPDC089752]|uniref:sensor histidine kinase n=1 Tax=Pseudomonas sp. NPDC089752 TaxID=3364472 RepID=UPI00381E9ACB